MDSAIMLTIGVICLMMFSSPPKGEENYNRLILKLPTIFDLEGEKILQCKFDCYNRGLSFMGYDDGCKRALNGELFKVFSERCFCENESTIMNVWDHV